MRRALAILVLVGCGHPAKPTATVRNAAPPPAVKPPETGLPKDCELDEAKVRVAGEPLQIATCTVATKDEGGGMKSAEEEAYLVRAGGNAHFLGTWNQGWEWGGDWEIVSAMSGAIVFVREASHNVDMGSETLHALQRKGDDWAEVFLSGPVDQLEVTVTPDGSLATVVSCDVDKAGQDCLSDPAKRHVATLQWNGTKLVAAGP